ncbi:aminomethyl-transferring glycine dehydrogenase subunit GcvPA [Govanella unica]|uniref:Probable glycine dehydrogenase (decarboxylating) subunit 1 n=1 Tax=Govanella unica TaxID=2975056 RepID=A0A9X3Z6U3_9PROT|nr:aminomethyl-transferring glycine dehydrogenase subunit GcvPA [Govania unica]MDA5193368.1 aminomethyl-transferring glycine dehydrogenase subunit GcvPA [Govania unica]
MRYLPLSSDDRAAMLARIGADAVDDLFRDVPAAARRTGTVDLPGFQGELEVERDLSALAARNISAGSVPFFVGAGAYRHHVPATVDHLIQRGEFLTSYTPYQPEITQGTLQVLFEFQTQVAMLTGMEVANASMYDGSTGAGEAVLMARRITRRKNVILSGGLHPQYADVVKTVTAYTDDQVTLLPPAIERADDLIPFIDKDTSCVVVQNPSAYGHVEDLRPLAEAAHAAGALLVVVVTEVVSLGAIESPGAMGADIVVGEGQSIGNGLNFGGPYLGLFATRQKYMRQMPGRLCGQTVDADGRRGFVLTLSTREQHIRREKATSNICTNSGLCALAFSIHMTLLGEAGIRQLAAINHGKAAQLADKLAGVPGLTVVNKTFFNEFTLKLDRPAAPVVEALAARRILAGVPLSRLLPNAGVDNYLLVASTEINRDADQDALVAGLKEVLA